MSTERRYAIITPYYKEERRLLERCIGSVKRQTVKTDHFMIADGHPQEWIDGEKNVRHVRLDRSHDDYGNTARGVGALLAAAERYDSIGTLDADNWLEPGHVELCLSAARAMPRGICDYVIARRNFVRADETIINVADEPVESHVDTSCFFFLRGSFHLLPIWALMPPVAGAIGDRVFYAAIKSHPLVLAVTSRPTVNFHCTYAAIYRAAGEEPPPDAKPNADPHKLGRWLSTLSDREIEVAGRLAGVRFFRGPGLGA